MQENKGNDLLQQLGAAMSDISEECWNAGWLGRTQDVLPELCRRAVETGKALAWGHGEITLEQALELVSLANKVGSWADLHPDNDSYIPYLPPTPTPKDLAYIDQMQLHRPKRKTKNYATAYTHQWWLKRMMARWFHVPRA